MTIREKERRSEQLSCLFLIFLFGCVAGWLYEEIFYWITEGTLQNRGVLYGPWLPIYGVGMVGVYALKPFKKNPVVLFLLCAGMVGGVEYLIGRIATDCFGLRLWDYRGEFCNLDGIICLRSVLTFALWGLAFHYLIEPAAQRLLSKLNKKIVYEVCLACLCLFFLDCIASILFRTPITY